jgi:hypothetical protein
MARQSKSSPASGRPPLASRRELNEFLEGIEKLRERVQDLAPAEQEQALRAYVLKNASREQQQRLFGRAFADALKSPTQKLGTAKAPAEPPERGEGRGKGRRKDRGKKRRTARKKSRR